MGAISQPIFQGGRLRAQVPEIQALQQAAIQNFKATGSFVPLRRSKTLFPPNDSCRLKRRFETSRSCRQNGGGPDLGSIPKRGRGNFQHTLEAQRRSFEAEQTYLASEKRRDFITESICILLWEWPFPHNHEKSHLKIILHSASSRLYDWICMVSRVFTGQARSQKHYQKSPPSSRSSLSKPRFYDQPSRPPAPFGLEPKPTCWPKYLALLRPSLHFPKSRILQPPFEQVDFQSE